ncbi:MAG: hypothetical protein V4619_17010 [Bacteroidota bacterium]
MATEKEAKMARDKYFDLLSDLGAHTLAVDYKDKDKSGFAILAFVEGDKNIPHELEIEHQGKKTNVPVVTERSEKFKPQ